MKKVIFDDEIKIFGKTIYHKVITWDDKKEEEKQG